VSLFPSGRRNPFWSAIITQVQGSVSVPALGDAYVSIQPPAGETWWIEIGFWVDYSSGYVTYFDYDGTTRRLHVRDYVIDTYGKYRSNLVLERILTNSLYASLHFFSWSAVTGYYGYSGFKLSKPLWSPERMLRSNPKAWKRKLTRPLPSEIASLEPHACEVYYEERGDYVLAIILEEDVPLAIDPATGFPIERLTAYITTENLMNILSQRDDPTLREDVTLDFPPKYRGRKLRELTGSEFEEATGYKKYLQRWRREGIEI